ncbi:GtrA family protein [Kribbella sp. NPDC051770]|uniref:GtrA family protein n=1 Tax=Kribbella sp. NPDC051770 TaxID=3155413 RepID=UPI00341361C7
MIIPLLRGTIISVAQLPAKLLRDHRVRYLIVGAGTNVLYFGLFWLGWHLLEGRLPYLVVTALANFTTALIMYPAYRTFVFGSQTGWLRGFAKFYTVYLFGLACSLIGMPLLIELLHTPVLLAQGLVILLVPVASYLLHRFWTFRDVSHTPVDA